MSTVTLTKTQTNIRALALIDLNFVLAAQKASSTELDAMEPAEIAFLLAAGKINGLVLEGDGRKMLVTWQRDGRNALLTAFYREGSAKGFLKDCRRLLDRTEGILREFGVTNVFAGVGYRNPLFTSLIKLYGRLGFGPDLLRVGKAI